MTSSVRSAVAHSMKPVGMCEDELLYAAITYCPLCGSPMEVNETLSIKQCVSKHGFAFVEWTESGEQAIVFIPYPEPA